MNIKRAIITVFLGLALMLSALSATAQTYDFEATNGTFSSIRDNRLATSVLINARDRDGTHGVFDTIDIPFEFYFFNQRITSLVPTTNLWLSTNRGFVCNTGPNNGSCSIPRQSSIDGSSDTRFNHLGAIYPFWTDSRTGLDGQVHHLTTQDQNTGGRVLTIEFSKFPANSRSQSQNQISFQVRLFEANSNIEFHYGSITNPTSLRVDSTFIGIAGSATFLTDSTTTRYYSVQSLNPGPDPAPTASDRVFTTFPSTRTNDDRFPSDGQIYRFTPTYLPIPDDVSASVDVPFSVILPSLQNPTGGVLYLLEGLPTGTGLSFEHSNRTLSGILSGTPTEATDNPITLTYTARDFRVLRDNTDNVEYSQTFMFEVRSGYLPTPDDISATVDVNLSVRFPALQNPMGEVRYTMTGPPDHLAGFEHPFDERTLTLRGIPPMPVSPITGTYCAIDDLGRIEVNYCKTFMFEVKRRPIPPRGTQSFVFVAGERGSTGTRLLFTGGDGDLTYAIVPPSVLPTGLIFNTLTSEVSGTAVDTANRNNRIAIGGGGAAHLPSPTKPQMKTEMKFETASYLM